MNHTKAPWHVEVRESKENLHIRITGSKHSGYNENGEYLSLSGIGKLEDANLAASAPELLEALMLDNCFPTTTVEQQNEAELLGDRLGWKRDMPLENFAQILRRNAIKKATTLPQILTETI